MAPLGVAGSQNRFAKARRLGAILEQALADARRKEGQALNDPPLGLLRRGG